MAQTGTSSGPGAAILITGDSEESDRAFAFAKWKATWIGNNPTPAATKMPTRVRFSDAVDDINNADDSAELEVLRNSNAVFVFYTTQVGLEGGGCGTRVNQQWTPMICAPRSILNVFVTIDDEPSPWLT
jgi:hypothetical protein